MPFLNLNKLLPARKAWKVFTNKVQRKLHKLNKSKTIKKPKNRFNKPPKRISWPALCAQGKSFKHKKKPSKTLVYHAHQFQIRPSAVYIDQLFIEPVTVVQEHAHEPSAKAAAVCNKETPSSSGEKDELGDHDQEIVQVMGEEDSAADDMWESLVLESPQMNGINERAEEFIARFRAEMLLQEKLARPL